MSKGLSHSKAAQNATKQSDSQNTKQDKFNKETVNEISDKQTTTTTGNVNTSKIDLSDFDLS